MYKGSNDNCEIHKKQAIAWENIIAQGERRKHIF